MTLPLRERRDRWNSWRSDSGNSIKEQEINNAIRRGGPGGTLSNYFKLDYAEAKQLIPKQLQQGWALFIQLGLDYNHSGSPTRDRLKPFISYALKNKRKNPKHPDRLIKDCFELSPKPGRPAAGNVPGNLFGKYFRCLRNGWRLLLPGFNLHNAFNYPPPPPQAGSTERVEYFILDDRTTLSQISNAVHRNQYDLWLLMGYWDGNCTQAQGDSRGLQLQQLNTYIDVFKPVLMAAPRNAATVPIEREGELLKGQELREEINGLKSSGDLSDEQKERLNTLEDQYGQIDENIREIIEDLNSSEQSITKELGDINFKSKGFLNAFSEALSLYPMAYILNNHAYYDLAHPCPQECDR